MKTVFEKSTLLMLLAALTACGGGGGTAVDTAATPAVTPSVTSYLGVAAGGGHTVAIKSDGTLLAWGLNRNGQLGDGTSVDRSSPVQVGVGASAVGSVISAGEFHTAALSACSSAGAGCSLSVWGANESGRLGDGTTVEKRSPTKLTGTTWLAVSAGGSHTAAVQKDGSIWTWGRNFNGQLGDVTNLAKTIPTKLVSTLASSAGTAVVKPLWINVAAGGSHTIALLSTGAMYRWGGNSRGQLGINSTTDLNYPGILGGAGTGSDAYKYTAIATGGDHSLAIRDNGELYSWGGNGFGQLGVGTILDVLTPTRVGTDFDWESISAGGGHNDVGNDLPANGGHSLAIKTDGTLWAWGSNSYGQLGTGITEDATSPTQISVFGIKWKRVSAGKLHSFAWDSDGHLWGWGNNDSGQLGNGKIGGVVKVPTRMP
jgi:alpha-tubulin suppressor-like RCC1 family protein